MFANNVLAQDVLLYVPSTSEQTPFEIIYKTPEKSTPIIEEIPITSTNTETAGEIHVHSSLYVYLKYGKLSRLLLMAT